MLPQEDNSMEGGSTCGLEKCSDPLQGGRKGERRKGREVEGERGGRWKGEGRREGERERKRGESTI